MRILIIGASGFIGSHVLTAGRSTGLDVVGRSSVRVQGRDAPSDDPAGAWVRRYPEAFDRLCRQVAGFDAVINAAGVADARRPLDDTLEGANALQPAIVSQACGMAGVRRFVHVSTAAVQGRIDPLDETTSYQPLSPYAASKAEGERLVLDANRQAPPEVVIYRPGSVHGIGRPVTRTVARLARAPVVAVSGRGDQPLPVALVDNVAAGIVFAASDPSLVATPSRVVVLHPSEGMTARRLLQAFGARRILSVPRRVAEATLRTAAAAAAARRSPGLGARVRWLELLWRGQSVRAVHLAAAGFTAPLGPGEWFELGRQVRAHVGDLP